jgi:hypothetical protein
MIRTGLVTLPANAAGPLVTARDDYVQYYGTLLGFELKEADARYEEAYRQYRMLPVEQDAFAAQDVVQKLFQDATK